MSLRSSLARLAIATAAGVLAGAVAVTPAAASDDWGAEDASRGVFDSQGGGHHDGHHDARLYQGVVTADRLLLRSAPTRGSQVIRAVHRGDVVSIFCKTPGDKVGGNPLWYLLTDGTWAWGAARFIDNIGPAPRWC
ncbi:SH3 domain-containing protein [Streptomyces pharetrae]|uniref:SH3 domain-containing protein n=1 Tax=Streptomyces pharetrae TaxID=291370 RepID=UPI00334C19DD